MLKNSEIGDSVESPLLQGARGGRGLAEENRRILLESTLGHVSAVKRVCNSGGKTDDDATGE
eukprot:scaffold2896_cov349-Pinguiococcus_pyrenoidosus.AAC.2